MLVVIAVRVPTDGRLLGEPGGEQGGEGSGVGTGGAPNGTTGTILGLPEALGVITVAATGPTATG